MTPELRTRVLQAALIAVIGALLSIPLAAIGWLALGAGTLRP